MRERCDGDVADIVEVAARALVDVSQSPYDLQPQRITEGVEHCGHREFRRRRMVWPGRGARLARH
jgi:hypothetical protein